MIFIHMTHEMNKCNHSTKFFPIFHLQKRYGGAQKARRDKQQKLIKQEILFSIVLRFGDTIGWTAVV